MLMFNCTQYIEVEVVYDKKKDTPLFNVLEGRQDYNTH